MASSLAQGFGAPSLPFLRYIDEAYLCPLCAFLPILVILTIYLAWDAIRPRELPGRRLTESETEGHSGQTLAPQPLDYQSPGTFRRPPRFHWPGANAIRRCLAIVVLFAAVSWLLVALEYRQRSTTITFVDELTGSPVPIDINKYPDFYLAQEDTSVHYHCNVTLLRPNVVKMDWNSPTYLCVTEPGYDSVSFDLDNDQSPKLAKLKRTKK